MNIFDYNSIVTVVSFDIMSGFVIVINITFLQLFFFQSVQSQCCLICGRQTASFFKNIYVFLSKKFDIFSITLLNVKLAVWLLFCIKQDFLL